MHELEHLVGLVAEGDAGCTVDLLGHGLDLLLGRLVVGVGEVEGWL